MPFWKILYLMLIIITQEVKKLVKNPLKSIHKIFLVQ